MYSNPEEAMLLFKSRSDIGDEEVGSKHSLNISCALL